jgi:NADPH:quinone reductase-like Zn-dependent oxidoreductase
MRAIGFTEFGGPELLKVVDLPEPEPGPGGGPHPRPCGGG